VIMLSSIGLPGTNGFIGEFLVLLGAFRPWPTWTIFATTGVILSAVYMLWMFQRVFYGKITNSHNADLKDLSFREWAIVGPLAAAAAPASPMSPSTPSGRRSSLPRKASTASVISAVATTIRIGMTAWSSARFMDALPR